MTAFVRRIRVLRFPSAVAIVFALALGLPTGSAGCVVTSADPETLASPKYIYSGGGTGVYVGGGDYREERKHAGSGYDVDSPTQPPPENWGFMFGDGTWYYWEANGLPGLQRGGPEKCVAWLPGQTYPVYAPARCVLFDGDRLQDQTCGRGPDRMIYADEFLREA